MKVLIISKISVPWSTLEDTAFCNKIVFGNGNEIGVVIKIFEDENKRVAGLDMLISGGSWIMISPGYRIGFCTEN